mmetsp:Transcript_12255/g.14864  ORF Transcript_12255/g.14864 Transcript_12255/m.14864 type:complete len:341 (+) Transcript_12255:112-1134(+)
MELDFASSQLESQEQIPQAIKGWKKTIQNEAKEILIKLFRTHKGEFRPWIDFAERFNLPKAEKSILVKRVFTNLLYYRLNYAYLAALVFLCVTVVWASLQFLWFGITSVALPYVFSRMRLKQGYNVRANWKQSFIITLTGSVFHAFFMGCLEPFLTFATISVVITATHVLLRPRSLRSKIDDESGYYDVQSILSDVYKNSYVSLGNCEEGLRPKPDTANDFARKSAKDAEKEQALRNESYLKRREAVRRKAHYSTRKSRAMNKAAPQQREPYSNGKFSRPIETSENVTSRAGKENLFVESNLNCNQGIGKKKAPLMPSTKSRIPRLSRQPLIKATNRKAD